MLPYIGVFLAFIVCAALIRSWVVGDYRWRPMRRDVGFDPPPAPDPAVKALKADLKKQLAAEARRGY